MEGTSVSALKALASVCCLVLLSTAAFAQQQESLQPAPSPAAPIWKPDPSQFLECNHFGVVKELQDHFLWLQVGYGTQVMDVSSVGIGLEGLAWSRLRTLTDFRFPVETIDYYFGAFFTWGDNIRTWRARIGHISSHDVDGKDSVFGGASSKYSREFVELTYRSTIDPGSDFITTLGVRGFFHQVTKVEPWVCIPVSLAYTILDKATVRGGSHFEGLPTRYNLDAFVSSGSGPVWPSFAAGIRFARSEYEVGALDLQAYYQYGASWAGTDAGAKRGAINLQMDVRGF